MNDPEVIMTTAFPATGFEALDKALEAACLSVSLVTRVPAPFKPIADQVVRSASSVPANIAEGVGRSGRASAALQLFDDVRAMTWRLLHPST